MMAARIMIISDEREFVFVHIPKCAGTSVKRALRGIDTSDSFFEGIGEHPAMGTVHFAHLTLADLAAHYPETLERIGRYRSLAIVRDPSARFYSAIFQRLREFKGIAQSAITDAMIASEADEIIAYLETAPARLDLAYVHFNRQCDFVELDGRRFVGELYALDDMAVASRRIGQLTGIDVGNDRQNRTTELSIGALRPVQRLLRDRYVRLVPADRRHRLREQMTRLGFYRSVPQQKYNLPGGRTERFICDYYARDQAILDECNAVSASRAT